MQNCYDGLYTSFNGLPEPETRPDAPGIILQKYQETDVSDYTRSSFLELLLGQAFVLCALDEEQLHVLAEAVSRKHSGEFETFVFRGVYHEI